MLTVVNLVVSHYWVAVCANLDSSESVAIDVVVLNETAPLAKDVHTALVPVVDLVFPTDTEQGRVITGPDAFKTTPETPTPHHSSSSPITALHFVLATKKIYLGYC